MADYAQAINPQTGDTVVANGGTQSAVIDLKGRSLVGVFIPAGLEGTTLGFAACATVDGTYVTLMSAGSAVSLTVAASRYVALDPNLFLGVRFLKLVLASQTGDITLTYVIR